MLHTNVAADWRPVVGSPFDEGATEYLEQHALRTGGIRTTLTHYPNQRAVVEAYLAAGTTQDALFRAYLSGRADLGRAVGRHPLPGHVGAGQDRHRGKPVGGRARLARPARSSPTAVPGRRCSGLRQWHARLGRLHPCCPGRGAPLNHPKVDAITLEPKRVALRQPVEDAMLEALYAVERKAMSPRLGRYAEDQRAH
jgi:hypothetical protein